MDDATNRVWYADFYVLRAGDDVGCLAIDGLAIDTILVDRTRHTNASIAAWFKGIVKTSNYTVNICISETIITENYEVSFVQIHKS